jgi:hypothetical protein
MRKENKLIPGQLTGDLRRGGYTLSGTIEGDTNAVAYGDSWQLLIKSGAEYVDSDWTEVFNGHIIAEPDPLNVDRYTSQVNITAGTMQELLSGESIQDIGFTKQASPANEHQITAMNFGKIMNHIINNHCNVIYNATDMPDGVIIATSVDTTNSTPLDRYNVYKSDNMWRTMQGIGGGEDAGEFYICYFDRHNKFYYQPAPPFWDTPPTSKGTITKNHLTGPVRINRNTNQPGQRIGQVQITAIKNFNTVYTAKYPSQPGPGKILPSRDGIWADSQGTANTLAQRLYLWLTRPYTIQIEIDPALFLLADDGQGLDIANKVHFTYDGPTEDTLTGAGFHIDVDDDFFIYGVSIRFDVFNKMASCQLTLEQDPT